MQQASPRHVGQQQLQIGTQFAPETGRASRSRTSLGASSGCAPASAGTTGALLTAPAPWLASLPCGEDCATVGASAAHALPTSKLAIKATTVISVQCWAMPTNTASSRWDTALKTLAAAAALSKAADLLALCSGRSGRCEDCEGWYWGVKFGGCCWGIR